MFVVTGASGNTGSVVANTLLDNHKQIRVIGRKAEHLQQFTKRGAEAVVAELADTIKLKQAFTGAEGVYAMIPPNPSAPDIFAYEDRITSSLVSALKDAKVRHVVALSSVGADKSSGTGLILALHRLEKALDSVPGLNTLHLRAGYFMENTLAQVGIIKGMGSAAGPVRAEPEIADDRLPRYWHCRGEWSAGSRLQWPPNARASGATRHQLCRGHCHHRKSHRQSRLAVPAASRRTASPQPGKHGHVAEFHRSAAGDVGSPERGTREGAGIATAKNTTPTSFERFVAERFVPAYQALSTAA